VGSSLKKAKIKIAFCIKTTDELDKLSHEELLKYIKELQKNIVQEKPKKTSNNSSIAPSTDINKKKKNQSLRKKSGNKPGGQLGRVARTLHQSEDPDEIISIPFAIEHCKKCNSILGDTLEALKEKRQVLDIDLKKIGAKIKEYQSFSKVCPVCGYENHDNAFSNDVTPYISYGVNIQALVSYLSVSHYLSYARIVQILSNLFNIKLSEGTVDKILKRSAKASQNEIEKIKARLTVSGLVGIDETGCKVNGNRHWNWVFQNSEDTLIVINRSRATKVIDDTFEDGFVNACVVHDNYSSYSSLIAQSEQLCLAHKLRDINYAIECDDTILMKDMKLLIKESMLDHKEKMTIVQRAVLKQEYEASFDYLLNCPVIEKSETHKQIKSLTKSRDKIFTFLLHPNIPPDNNGSERAIRNVKVKLKVSGQFKTFQGAEDYAALRSIIDTSRKRDLNEFDSLVGVIRGDCVF
jgi:transposase-like protein